MQVSARELSAQMGMIKTVVSWCDALQGGRPLRRALSAVLESIDASAVVLSRVSSHQDGKSDVICVSSRSFELKSPEMKSFAHELLGSYAGKAKLGSIWSSTFHSDERFSRIAQFQQREQLQELVVIPLSATRKQLDFLEIHSAHKSGYDQSEAFEEFAVSLSDTWQTRKPGIFSSALPKARSFQRRSPKASTAPIMSFENPAGLSKAEYRVCATLNRGLTTDELCDELQISKATLRTHLRNIYEKTNAESLPQLMYALVSCAPFENDYLAAG